MGNVCATKQAASDRFPTDNEVTEVSIEDMSDVFDVFDDTMFIDYMEGKHELVENMTNRGSSFFSKTKLRIEIPSFSDSLPHLCTRSGGDHLFFGEPSPDDLNFGLRIQSPRPMPLCFRRQRTPPGSPRCFDSDCKSQFSDSSFVFDSDCRSQFSDSSSVFQSSLQSTPPPSQASMSGYEDGKSLGEQEFDKSVWIWPPDHASSRVPPKLNLVQEDKGWLSPRHPQCTPLVNKNTSNFNS